MLYRADCSFVELSAINLPPNGSASLDVGAELAAHRLPIEAEGSFLFRYAVRIAHALSAETLITNEEHSLAYTIPSYEDRPSSAKQFLTWWKPSSKSEVYAALQNTSDYEIVVQASVRMGGVRSVLKETRLSSHQIKTMSFPDDLDPAGKAAWASNEVGGLELTMAGPVGALNISGWVEDEALGFSTMLSFHDPAMAASNELIGTQVLLGQQTALKPVDVVMFSRLVLRNVTEEPVSLHATFFYEMNGTQGQLLLPLTSLAAQEIKSVELNSLQRDGLIPAGVRSGSVRVEYVGANGAVMGRVFSISNDGTLGLYTALESFAGPGGSGVYWTIDGGWNTLITATNFGQKTDQMNLTLTYPNGVFQFPAMTLAPMQSITFNLKEIASGAVLDRDGHKWPVGMTAGGYKLMGSRVASKLLIKQHTIDSDHGFATPFYTSISYVAECFAQSTYEVGVGEQIDVTPKALANVDVSEAGTCPVSDFLDSRDDVTVTVDQNSIASVTVNALGLWMLTGNLAGNTRLTAVTLPRPSGPYGLMQMVFQAQAGVVVAGCTPVLTMSPSEVVRAQRAVFTVNTPAGCTGALQLSEWKFTGQDSIGTSVVISRIGNGRSWPSNMVLGGTVSVRAARGGTAYNLSVTVLVKDRDSFKLTAAAPQQKPEGFVSPAGQQLVFPHPPTNIEGGTAKFALDQIANWIAGTVNDQGANQGLRYVTSVDNHAEFYFALSNEVESSPGVLATGQFAQAQCGNYNAQTNATGFISLTQLASNLRGHEAGAIKSHWTLYKTAQDEPDKNMGSVADRFVRTAGVTDTTFNSDMARRMDSAIQTIGIIAANDTLLSPADPQHDQAGNFWGYVNWAPYRPCP